MMRMQSIAPFVLFGLLVAGSVEAQTWESPYVLWPNGTDTSNTCGASNMIGSFDGYPANGPDQVYNFLTLVRPRHFRGGFGGGNRPRLNFSPLFPTARIFQWISRYSSVNTRAATGYRIALSRPTTCTTSAARFK